MEVVSVHEDVKNAGRYYRLLVMVQAMALFVFMGLRHFAPRTSHGAARVHKALLDIRGNLPKTLEMFKADCGRYPTTEEGWKVLMNAPTDGSLTNWHGPYLDPSSDCLADPWGYEYVYHFPATRSTNSYDVYSLGLDEESKRRTRDAASLLDGVEDWLLLIPLMFMASIIAQMTSPHFRAVARENRLEEWIWFVIAVIAFALVFLVPRIST